MSGKNPHAIEAQGLGTAYDRQNLPSTASNTSQDRDYAPGGIYAGVKHFFMEAAPRPVEDIAEAGAISYLAGLCGNVFNISGTGLNQYTLSLAPTGMGKDAVADGIGRLNDAVWYSRSSEPFPHMGPGEIVSSAGLIKWLVEKPCILAPIGEFGKKLAEMANPNRQHLYGLGRTLLQLYSKSGKSGSFDPIAYSDREKVTKRIARPSLSIFAESVPENFYEILDQSLISDGLLPRFMVFDVPGKRVYLNKSAKEALPADWLVQGLRDLLATCSTIRSTVGAYEVPLEPNAEALFDEFDVWTTDTINGSQAEVTRHLWNRAHLKALKLAGLAAVAENWIEPVVRHEQAMWATSLIAAQTHSLIARFTNGDVGAEEGNEAKQIAEVVRVISGYLHSEYEAHSKYGGSFEMHRDGVVTEAHIQRRLITLKAFKPRPTLAIKQALKSLLEADELREVPRQQMIQRYGTGPRAFCVANPGRFRQRV